MIAPLPRILATIGSLITIGFGVWHFFVPKMWKWYSYIVPEASELVAAVRAINVFFSLALVLLGVMTLLFIHSPYANRFGVVIVLAAMTLLWLVRVGMQIAYPQGTVNPALQYGMLATFIVVFLCFLLAFGMVLFNTKFAG